MALLHYAGDYFGRPWRFPKACVDNRIWYKYYLLTPWKEEKLLYRVNKMDWIKYAIKRLVKPFINQLWLKRTKNRFESINEWLAADNAQRNQLGGEGE